MMFIEMWKGFCMIWKNYRGKEKWKRYSGGTVR